MSSAARAASGLPTRGSPACPFPERLAGLRRVQAFLLAERRQVLEILTQVGTYRAGCYEIDAAVETLRGAAAELALHRPRRLGSAAVFMPSNVLLYSYVLYLLVPGLFVEETGFRPAAQVREQVEQLHRLLAPVHRLPLRLRAVSQREFLARDVEQAELLIFTGRAANAEQVRAALRPEQLMLFFGAGVNPFIVTAEAELTAAARDLADIRLFNSGQDCLAPDAVFVHRAVEERFLDALVDDLAGRPYGPYEDPAAGYGPIYYETAFDETTRYLFRNRDYVRYGGSVGIAELRIDPTVLVSGLGVRRELIEFFSPVFNVLVYDDERQLRETLGGNYFSERALGASVYGGGDDVAAYLQRKHIVTRNQTLLAVDQGNQPFGGRGWMANYIGHRGGVRSQPILVSQAVADHLGSDA